MYLWHGEYLPVLTTSFPILLSLQLTYIPSLTMWAMPFTYTYRGFLRLWLGGNIKTFCFLSRAQILCPAQPFVLPKALHICLCSRSIEQGSRISMLPPHCFLLIIWSLPKQLEPLPSPHPIPRSLTFPALTTTTLKKNDKIWTIFPYTGNGLPGIWSVAKISPSEPTIIFKTLLVMGHIRILYSAMKEKKANNKSPTVYSTCPQLHYSFLPHTPTHILYLYYIREYCLNDVVQYSTVHLVA